MRARVTVRSNLDRFVGGATEETIIARLEEQKILAQQQAGMTTLVENLEKEIKRVTGKLSNQGFLAKAPADVVEKEREKQKGFEEKKAAVEERITYLAAL